MERLVLKVDFWRKLCYLRARHLVNGVDISAEKVRRGYLTPAAGDIATLS
jgi:hypothetical protein